LEYKIKENLGHFILVALFAKLMAFGLSSSDCFGALVLLLFSYGSKALDYYVPKRPDLYADLKLKQEAIKALESKTEGLERDVSALKMERLGRR
jgi:hypothetical protein